jgi:hypothetical protein
MNMTEKNGQPSMEEILASIRRIIAEEPSTPSNGELRGTPIMLKGDGVLEDAGDFDLPAIFRASPPAPTERSTPLLGRLTDAIRSATTAQPESRGYVNGSNGVNGKGDDSGSEPADGASHLADPAYSGLSSLKPMRSGHGEPFPTESLRPAGSHTAYETGSSGGHEASLRAAASGGPPQEPKRVMAPFKDTHFLHITPASEGSAPQSGGPSQQAAPLGGAVQPNGASTDFSSIIPAQFDRAQLLPSPAAPPPLASQGPPPPLPFNDPPRGDVAEGTGTIEDTTADLLRPMLRQWLADNMPRMVEKALHIEIAESVKGPKKP